MIMRTHFGTTIQLGVKVESVWFIFGVNTWKEVGCMLTSNNINYTNCYDYTWDVM